jgi:hypothetical protein
MNTGKLLEFKAVQSGYTGASETNYKVSNGAFETVLSVEESSLHSARALLEPSKLYPNVGDENERVFQALRLLQEATDHLQAALEEDPEKDYTAFDNQIIRARIVLERAFNFRDIGDGYAGLVNALNCGLRNAEVEPLNRRQLGVIVDAIARLKRGPFMHFDSAMQIMDELESADLDIEPSGLDDFLPIDDEKLIFGNDRFDGSSPQNAKAQKQGS